MLFTALADGGAVDYASFLNRYIEDQESQALAICHPDQGRAAVGRGRVERSRESGHWNPAWESS